MSGTEKSHAALLDELAALDPPQRREVAAALQSVAETFAGVPDGRDTAEAGNGRPIRDRSYKVERYGATDRPCAGMGQDDGASLGLAISRGRCNTAWLLGR
jgi:hypothetical protein